MATNIAGVAGHLPTAPSDGAAATERNGGGAIPMWRDESGPSFDDLLDALNPLQHIPIVSSLYRAITGDRIGHIPRVIGDTLFGGPVGMLMAGIHGMIKEATGAEPSEHVVALVKDLTGFDGTAITAAEQPDGIGHRAARAASNTPVSETVQPSAAAAGSPNGAALFGPGFHTRPPSRLQSTGTPSHTIRASDAERERRRVAAAIFEAQRAQSQLLLSSVGLSSPAESRPAESRPAQPAPHTNLPPPETSAEWIAQAMEKGLRKYETASRIESLYTARPAVDALE